MKIAIIDDNEYDRLSLRALLTESGAGTASEKGEDPVTNTGNIRAIGSSSENFGASEEIDTSDPVTCSGNVSSAGNAAGKTFANEAKIDLYGSAEEFLAGFIPGKYRIIFLDIYMEETDGIQAARKIREQDVSCIIIFLTTSLEHRADAFSVHAFDYLEKPVAKERLSDVMKDALSFLATQRHASPFPAAQDQADLSSSQVTGARGVVPSAPPSLSLMKGKNSYRLLYTDIRSVLSDMQYCIVKTEQEDRFRASFRNIETALTADERFLLINRGILVNMDYVSAMEGTACHMTDGSEYPINTRKQTAIRQSYISYQFDKRARRISNNKWNTR